MRRTRTGSGAATGTSRGLLRRAALAAGALVVAGLMHGDVAQAKKKKIEFPAGWDDATINLIKEGKSTEKVLAVLEFQGNEVLTEKAQVSMSEMLATALAQTNRFVLVEREVKMSRRTTRLSG